MSAPTPVHHINRWCDLATNRATCLLCGSPYDYTLDLCKGCNDSYSSLTCAHCPKAVTTPYVDIGDDGKTVVCSYECYFALMKLKTFTCLECHQEKSWPPYNNSCPHIDQKDESIGFCSLACIAKHNGLTGCKRAREQHGAGDERRLRRAQREEENIPDIPWLTYESNDQVKARLENMIERTKEKGGVLITTIHRDRPMYFMFPVIDLTPEQLKDIEGLRGHAQLDISDPNVGPEEPWVLRQIDGTGIIRSPYQVDYETIKRIRIADHVTVIYAEKRK